MNFNSKPYITDYDPFFEAATGELLQFVRERRGLTLKHIADKTKIHVGILINLEKNNFQDLPSKPYVRGFVKAISVCLGIEIKKALELLDAAYEQIRIENAPLVVDTPVKSDNFIIQKMSDLKLPGKVPDVSKQYIAGVMFLVLGIVSIGIGMNYSGKINQQAQTTEAMPVVATVVAAPVAPPAIVEPLQSMAVEEKITVPDSDYPKIVGLNFPKSIDSVAPGNHF
jgi:cytoskeletal protein RodZ